MARANRMGPENKGGLKEFYSSSAAYLRRLEKNDGREYSEYLAAAAEGLPPLSKVLECGCGLGNSSWLLSQRGFDVTGTDLSPRNIEEARRRHPGSDRLRFLVEDSAALSFGDASFDAVCSALMLEHVAEVEKVLLEMARVLKPGGRLTVALPSFLDPFQQLSEFLSWKGMARPRPWESGSRSGALLRFFAYGWIKLAKVLGADDRIHYLTPVVSEREEECGADYDATWLANHHDVLRILRRAGLSATASFPSAAPGPVVSLLRKTGLPEALLRGYERTRASGFMILARKGGG